MHAEHTSCLQVASQSHDQRGSEMQRSFVGMLGNVTNLVCIDPLHASQHAWCIKSLLECRACLHTGSAPQDEVEAVKFRDQH